MKYSAACKAREEVHLELELDGTCIMSANLTGIGDLSFLRTLEQWRGQFTGEIANVELPQGNSTGEILLREVILKAQGKWQLPFTEDELCHCRAVPTSHVNAAIACGAHTPAKVSRWTNASTQCGTCRPDVEKQIKYLLK